MMAEHPGPFPSVRIVGIGATEFSTASGRSELRLAVEACRAALDDAGLAPSAVDGMATFAADSNPEIEVARALGASPLRFFARTQYGGGDYCGTVRLGAMAVELRLADVVVCYRAFNERSGGRYGQGMGGTPPLASADLAQYSWSIPHGLVNAAGWMALFGRRYMHEYGATSEDFGRVTVAARRFAADNPKARFFGRPITLADHQASRWIVEPLHLLDCCLETDGAVAVVMARADRAADCRQRPVAIRAAAQGAAANQHLMANYYAADPMAFEELDVAAAELWRQCGLGPTDVQAAIVYDHFTPMVLAQLEGYGFCGRGEGKDFVADGHIGPGGRLPVNPHGGQLGEAYLHGMNGVNEAVRQVRGHAVNQIDGIEHVLLTAPPGVPTSSMVLGPA